MFTVGMRIMLWETWTVYSFRNKKPKVTESYAYTAVDPKGKDQIWLKEMAETMWNFSQQPKLWYHQIQQEASNTSIKARIHPRDVLITVFISAMNIFPSRKIPWSQLNPISKRKCSQVLSWFHKLKHHIQSFIIPSLSVFLCLPSQSLSADGNILEMVGLFR